MPRPLAARHFLLTPISDRSGVPAEDVLHRLLDSGWYVLGKRSQMYRFLAPGDQMCVYLALVGIVAEATLASHAERDQPVPYNPDAREYPWAFRVRDVRYFLNDPVELDRETRARLDAFARSKPDRPWSWFVQRTHLVSAHDFRILVGRA